MINQVHIENFKSIRRLTFGCKRVNLIIGQPNTGKSNILEALALLSSGVNDMKRLIRFRELNNLFYDNDVSQKILVTTDTKRVELLFEDNNFYFKEKGYSIQVTDNNFHINFTGVDGVLYYKYSPVSNFVRLNPLKLKTPHGENLFELLQSNPDLRRMVADIFSGLGYKLQLRTQNMEIEFVKEENNVLITYPWQSLSDTIQRIIFYNSVIDTNKDSTILLEEPEANTFPLYTKLLGEKIALDDSNQYFVVTHNPFFLLSALDKAPMSDIAIFIAEYEDYSTKLKEVQSSELPQILELDSDVFLNLNKFGK
ncbi:MAG: AAA family ATPase [Bacteroidales bacterium]|nr:AAA family ATPase [Bacteroidales bacterium]